MKTLKQQLADKRAARSVDPDKNRKSRRTVKHAAKHRANNTGFMNLMLMPNERIQSLIVQGTNSSYVPVPKTDHLIDALDRRMNKEAKRKAAWTGATA